MTHCSSCLIRWKSAGKLAGLKPLSNTNHPPSAQTGLKVVIPLGAVDTQLPLIGCHLQSSPLYDQQLNGWEIMLRVFSFGEVGVSGRCIWFYWTETQSLPIVRNRCAACNLIPSVPTTASAAVVCWIPDSWSLRDRMTCERMKEP